MAEILEWKDIIEEKNGVEYRKNDVKLNIDCIYKNRAFASNTKNEVLPKLMGVGNRKGFRYRRNNNDNEVKYVVLVSSNNDIYWQDEIDEEFGLCKYYGDNKIAGKELHETDGNKILRQVYNYAVSSDKELRKKIPPFFLFYKDKIGGVQYKGLLAPGFDTMPSKDWLKALWSKRDEGGRFQNYEAIFTILDTSAGSEFRPGEAAIDLRWLDDLMNGKGYDSIYAPFAWKTWIEKGKYTPLISNVRPRYRTKKEQLPEDENKKKMLKTIVDYFQDDLYAFEYMAMDLVKISDDNIPVAPERTRRVRDGGRDGIGDYIIMGKLKVTYAVEAKCHYINSPVGVTETSRLISRIRHRQFGVIVTTSYVHEQAYKEIINDEHPIIVLSGIDIIDLLFKIGITNNEQLIDHLHTQYDDVKVK